MEGGLVKNWNALLQKFPDEIKDVYFQEEYMKLYEKEAEEAVCFVFEKNDKIFLFPFLRRQFEYQDNIYYDFETAYGYGGPIANVEDDEFFNQAMESFKNYCSEHNYIAGFVRFHPLINNQKILSKIGSVIFDRHTVAIDLSLSDEEIWMKEIHKQNRNLIKKGAKLGLEFIVDREFKNIDEFVKLYDLTMNKVGADSFYYFDKNYYILFKSYIKNSFLGLVKFNGEIIAGAIFFYSEDYGHYHLSASNPKYLRMNPNNFMLFEASKELKVLGIKKFHLGGGYDAEEQNSLFQFKRKFSRSKYDFYIGKLIFNQMIYSEICEDWIKRNPQKQEKYKHYLLKYKY